MKVYIKTLADKLQKDYPEAKANIFSQEEGRRLRYVSPTNTTGNSTFSAL